MSVFPTRVSTEGFTLRHAHIACQAKNYLHFYSKPVDMVDVIITEIIYSHARGMDLGILSLYVMFIMLYHLFSLIVYGGISFFSVH